MADGKLQKVAGLLAFLSLYEAQRTRTLQRGKKIKVLMNSHFQAF